MSRCHYTPEDTERIVEAYSRVGKVRAAAELGMSVYSVRNILARCKKSGLVLVKPPRRRTPRTTPTRRSAEVLAVIRALNAERGFPPTVREIGERMNISSSSTVQTHIRALERLGLLTRDESKPRSLTIVGEQCPTCGRAA